MISVVVPAHNEEARLGVCLAALLDGAPEGSVDIVVVPNGCDDRTAEIARSFGPPVRVVEIDTASKVAALNAGDAAAQGFPRFYIDGDVVIRWGDVQRIAAALDDAPTALAAPARVWRTEGRPWIVRAYFDVLRASPQAQDTLTGGGVLAVTKTGRARFGAFPEVQADDRFLETRFQRHERRTVTSARSIVETPKEVRALVHRRARVILGNRALERGYGGPPSAATVQGLLEAVRKQPRLAASLPAFLLITALARLRARQLVRRGDDHRWQRDDSSR